MIHNFGGAAGYCPPVQKVTYYPSTSLVQPMSVRRRKLKAKQKYLLRRAEKFPF